MHAPNPSRLELFDGEVVLYLRDDIEKPIWHCRIKLPSYPYVRKSLKTRNAQEAIRRAEKLYADVRYRLESGLCLTSRPFKQVAASFLTKLAEEAALVSGDATKGNKTTKKLTNYRKYLKYAEEYFADKHIDKITDRDIVNFDNWRSTYWLNPKGKKPPVKTYVRAGKTVRMRRTKAVLPAPSTLASERVALRAVFKHAIQMGWLTQIPNVPTQRQGDARRRPSFTEQEFEHLMAVSKSRINEKVTPAVKFARQILHHFIGMVAFTGARPFEMMGVRWEDVRPIATEGSTQTYTIFVSGKRKERWLVALPEAHKHLVGLAALAGGEIGQLKGYLFVSPDGERIASFKKGLRSLLKAAGLERDKNKDMRRDAYCFRHYYCEQRLLKSVSVYTLAKQLGCGVSMIEKHYGFLEPQRAIKELNKAE